MAASDSEMEDPGGGVKYECGICLKEFSSSWCLQIHVKTHDVQRSFDCHECGMIFQDFATLCEHLKQHIFGEEPVEETIEVCSICGKEYPVSQIEMHKRSHIFKPGLTCKTCGKSFGSSQVLKLHLKTHGTNKLYECKICNAKFFSRNAFTLHWTSHAPDKAHASDISTENARKGKRPLGPSKNKKTGNNFPKNNNLRNKTARNHAKKTSLMNDSLPFLGFIKKLRENYFCSVCTIKFKGKAQAEHHAKYHYDQEIQTGSADRLESHVEVQNNNGNLPGADGVVRSQKLNIKQESRPKNTKDHINEYGDNEKAIGLQPNEGTLSCSECDETFNSYEDLQQHRHYHVRDYALSLMRVLSPKKTMKLSQESESLLESLNLTAKLRSKVPEDQMIMEAKADSHPDEANDLEGCEKTIQDLNKGTSEVPSSSKSNGFLLYQEVSKHMMTKDSQIHCKICLKQFYSVEKITTHIMKHLDKVDDKNDLLKDFPDLYKMTSVRVVLERLDIKGPGASVQWRRNPLNDVHSTSVPIVSNDKSTNLASTIENVTGKPKETSPTEDIPLDLICTNVDDGNMYGTGNNCVPQHDVSDDDMDRFQDDCSDSDIRDEEWLPHMSNFFKSRSTHADFDTSDSENSSVDGDFSVKDEEHEDLNGSGHGFDAEICEKKKLDGHSNDASIGRLQASSSGLLSSEELADVVNRNNLNAPQSDSSSDTSETSQSLQREVSDASTTTTSLADNVNEIADNEIKSYYSRIGDMHVCSICSRRFDTASEVTDHISNHLKQDKFKCRFCGHFFDERSVLDLHEHIHEKQHSNVGVTAQDVKVIQDKFYKHDGAFKCKICNSHFKISITAYSHVLNHLYANRCEELIASADDSPFVQSSRGPSSKQLRDYKTRKGQQKFTNRDAMKFIVKKNGIFKCLKCSKRMGRLHSAKAHVKRHLTGAVFKCSVCPYATYTRHHLARHTESYHKKWYPKVEPVECIDTAVSGELKPEAVTLKNALQFIVKEKGNFKCTICDTTFTSKWNAHAHVVRHKQLGRFKCSYCGVLHYTRKHLAKHILTHKKRVETDNRKINAKLDHQNEGHFSFLVVQATVETERSTSETGTNAVLPSTMISDDEAKSSYRSADSLNIESVKQCSNKDTCKDQCMCTGNQSRAGETSKPRLDSTFESDMSTDTHAVRHSGNESTRSNLFDFITGSLALTATDVEGPNKTNDKSVVISDGVDAADQGSVSCGLDAAQATVKSSGDFPESEEPAPDQIYSFKEDAASFKDDQKVGSGSDDENCEPVKVHRCDLCGRQYLKAHQLEFHKLIHQSLAAAGVDYVDRNSFRNTNPYLVLVCPVCRKECQSIHKLTNHVRIHTDEKKYKCHICGKAFVRKSFLLTHQNIHNKKMPSQCNLCPSTFPCHNNLTWHLRQSHTKDDLGGKMVACDICGKKLSWRNLKTHYILHDLKRFSCDICDNKFYTLTSLNAHEEKHSNSTVSKAKISDNFLNSENDVKEHKKIPTGQLPVKCFVCDKVFASHNILKRHSLVHTGERRHVCDICHKGFSRLDTLKYHRRTHDKEHFGKDEQRLEHGSDEIEEETKNFKCSVCDLYYKNANLLQSHKLVHQALAAVGLDYPHGGSSVNIKLSQVLTCPVCKKDFPTLWQLKGHVRVHTDKKKHKCDVCGLAFARRSYFLRHQNIHNNNLPFQCHLCSKAFPSQTLLQRHIRLGHRKEGNANKMLTHDKKNLQESFKQQSVLHSEEKQSESFCYDKKSSTLTDRNAHEQNHSNESAFSSDTSGSREGRVAHKKNQCRKCSVCDKTLKGGLSLRRHMLIHTGDRPYTCDICDRSFSRIDTMKSHRITHDNKQHDKKEEQGSKTTPSSMADLKCNLCGHQCFKASQLECHKLLHQALSAVGIDYHDRHSDRFVKLAPVLTCPVCRKEYPTLRKFTDHIHFHTDEKKYKCDFCGLAFAKYSYFLTHLNIHNNIRPFSCELCPRKYPSLNTLKKHVKNSHRKEKKEKKMVTCDICGKKLVAGSLSAHKILHDEMKHTRNFPCDLCEKKFYSSTHLKCHKKTHSGEANFMCDICGKFLRSKNILQEHKMGHTGEKPFKCSVCDRPFKTKLYLNRHILTHTGEKPHVCDVCNKAFSQPETLKNHRYIHTGEKPYKCDLCGERFGDRWAKHNHLKRHWMS